MEDENYSVQHVYTFDRNNSVKAENVLQHFDNTFGSPDNSVHHVTI